MNTVTFDTLEVRRYADRASLGQAAAARVADVIRGACGTRGEARVIFACAPSQREFFEALVRHPIAWSKVKVFHTEEYVGLRAGHPRSFRQFLRTHLLEHIAEPREVHLIQAEQDPMHEAARYGKLLGEKPIDVVCLAIGEDGHLAFGDPPNADFREPQRVEIVELETGYRRQQVSDGSFSTFDAVPTHALTVTLPTLMGAREASCVAAGEGMAVAVRSLLHGPVTPQSPISILRQHAHAVLHLDAAAASLLEP